MFQTPTTISVCALVIHNTATNPCWLSFLILLAVIIARVPSCAVFSNIDFCFSPYPRTNMPPSSLRTSRAQLPENLEFTEAVSDNANLTLPEVTPWTQYPARIGEDVIYALDPTLPTPTTTRDPPTTATTPGAATPPAYLFSRKYLLQR
jgi:hypothetical protein